MSAKEPILVKNIFYMLSYAYRELNRGEYAHLDGRSRTHPDY